MKKLLLPLLLLILPFVVPCGGASTSSSLPIAIEGMGGYVQKGPFVQGSSVSMQAKVEAVNTAGYSVFMDYGDVTMTQTTDNYGSFGIPASVGARYVDFTTSGYYYDEVEGVLSDSTKSLSAFAYVPAAVTGTVFTVNVNILTSLAQNRMLYLYSYGGTSAEEIAAKGSFSSALSLAQKNVLAAFNITSTTDNFYEMDIMGTGDSDAILLAASSITQGNNTVGELSELETKFKTQIETTGALVSGGVIETEIADNAKKIPLSEIRQNLYQRFLEINADEGIDVEPTPSPSFENWVDSSGITNSLGSHVVNSYKCQNLCKDPSSASCQSDCSGYVSGFSTNTYLWNKVIRPMSCSGAKIIDSTGAYAPTGVTCPKTTEAPYVGRTNYATVAFDNKIWLMGGSAPTSATAKSVYYTTDGIMWTQATSSASCVENRQNAALTVHGGKMYLIGGYNGSDYLDDVWSSSDGVTWTQLGSLPEPRRYASAVSYDDKIWVIGGTSTDETTGQLDILCSDDSGATWSGACGTLPFAGTGCVKYFGAVAFADRMWLSPGYVSIDITGCASDTGAYYSTDGTTWTETRFFDTGTSANYALVPFDSDGDGTDDQLWKIAGTLRAGTGTAANPFSYIDSSLSAVTGTDYTTYVGTPWNSTWFDSERLYLKNPIAGAMRVPKYDSAGAATGTYYNAMWLIGGKYGTAGTQSYDAWFFKVYDSYDYIGDTLIH